MAVPFVRPLLSSAWHALTKCAHVASDSTNDLSPSTSLCFTERQLAIWGSWLIGFVIFWGFAGVLAILELSNSTWLKTRKLQPGKYITRQDYLRAAWVALKNQIVVNIPTGYAFYYLTKLRGWKLDPELPSIQTMIRHFFIFVICEEIGFYFVHRAMHSKLLYARIHKVHHEFKAPVGMAALYAHWVEHFLVNLAPLLAGPLVAKAHLLTMWLWFTLAIVNATNTHSGYELPFLGSAQGHDDHHKLTYGNYGVTGFFDTLFGTKIKPPRARQEKQNDTHTTITSHN